MADWETIDYFGDESLVEDPYPYLEQLRSECPVLALPHLGVVAVTGYDEVNEIYRLLRCGTGKDRPKFGEAARRSTRTRPAAYSKRRSPGRCSGE